MKAQIIRNEPPKTKNKTLQKYYIKAKSLLGNEKKMESFLCKLEIKLKKIPRCGGKLAYAPIFASFLNGYFHKRYTEAPLGTIIAVAAALLYLVTPFDIIPDFTPIIGYIEDAGLLVLCSTLIKSDLDDYQEWRNSNLSVIIY